MFPRPFAAADIEFPAATVGHSDAVENILVGGSDFVERGVDRARRAGDVGESRHDPHRTGDAGSEIGAVEIRRPLLGGGAAISGAAGMQLFFAALPIAFGGLLSAIAQGKAAAAGIMMVGKRPEEFGKAIIFAVMVETYAVLSLLISFLLVNGVAV